MLWIIQAYQTETVQIFNFLVLDTFQRNMLLTSTVHSDAPTLRNESHHLGDYFCIRPNRA